jgi:DNA-directed RNA polymerase sigma subunit (sigma70/sigma32)
MSIHELGQNVTVEQHMASAEYQARLERDVALVARVQAGYEPAEATQETPRPRIIDGELSQDAQTALGELFTHYAPMAHGLAGQHSQIAHNKTSLSREDLFGQSYFGVYHAAVTYDTELEHSTSFTGHVIRTIDHHLKRFITEQGSLVRLPANVRADVSRYRRTIWSVYQRSERYPVREQVANAMGIDSFEADELASFEALTMQMGSINEGYFSDGRDQKSTYEAGVGEWQQLDLEATTVQDVDAEVITSAMRTAVHETLHDAQASGRVSEREVRVIKLRYFGTEENGWQPMTCEEAAVELTQYEGRQLSRERIRQIETKTIPKLLTPTASQKIRPYAQS